MGHPVVPDSILYRKFPDLLAKNCLRKAQQRKHIGTPSFACMCFQDEGVEAWQMERRKGSRGNKKTSDWTARVIENHEVDVNIRWRESGSTRKRFFVTPSERGPWRLLIVKTDKQQRGFFK